MRVKGRRERGGDDHSSPPPVRPTALTTVNGTATFTHLSALKFAAAQGPSWVWTARDGIRLQWYWYGIIFGAKRRQGDSGRPLPTNRPPHTLDLTPPRIGPFACLPELGPGAKYQPLSANLSRWKLTRAKIACSGKFETSLSYIHEQCLPFTNLFTNVFEKNTEESLQFIKNLRNIWYSEKSLLSAIQTNAPFKRPLLPTGRRPHGCGHSHSHSPPPTHPLGSLHPLASCPLPCTSRADLTIRRNLPTPGRWPQLLYSPS